MNFGKSTYIQAFFGILLAFFFLTSYFGAVTTDMPMNPDGTMSGCAMPGMATLCQMNPLEHIATWQNMFTAIPSQNDIFTLLLALFALVLGALFLRSHRSTAPPKTLVPQFQFLYYKRHIPIVSPLQEAFSNGILHPKIF